jgi:putative ABC transport system permease protein
MIAHSVSQRTHEIGIRMALGAQRTQLLRMVIREGMLLALTGVAAGIVGSIALSRVLGNLLFGINASDPGTFVAVAALFTVVTFVACYIPARRAMRVDPMVALRYE